MADATPVPPTVEKIPVYCYQCVAGPDLLKRVVRDGLAIGVTRRRPS